MLMRGSLNHGNMNNIYDPDGARQGRYGCMRGRKWVYIRANMGLGERAVIGLETQAVSAQVTKHFATIFSKTCNN